MAKKYNLLKAATWYTLGNILIKGISFFLLPVFTGLMSTRDYGIFSVYSSYLTLFQTVILLGLSATVRIAKYSDDTDFEEYMSTILKIPFFLTGIVMVFINVFFIWNVELLSMNIVLWNCLLITAAFSAAINIISTRLIIEGNYKAYMAYTGGYTIFNIVISLWLCYTIYKNNTYMARVVGGMIPNIVFGVVFSLIFIKRSKVYKDTLMKAIKLGIPLLIHTAASVILIQSDRILIKYFNGYEKAGIYSIAVTIIAIPMIFQSSLESAWAPWFYDKLYNREYGSIKKVNDQYIAFFGVVIAAFMIISPELIRIFTNKAYWDSVYSLIPLCMSVFTEMLYSLAVNIEYYNKKTWMITGGTLIAVVVNIVLNIVFINLFGYIGAAYGTVISKLVLFGIHWAFSRKVDSHPIFSTKYILASVTGLMILNILLVNTVNLYLVRYSIFVMIMIFTAIWLYRCKDDLLGVLKRK
jgi:O-antigen/teichoic acid export membrane protein